ncbi:MAG: iron-sulfur cluster repair di-iron protein, ric [Peptococcaceae bacterium]|nr:iron-sulfur cluster repair di-iron protein, ric [Peptococcaceae bacterium]
MSKQLSFNEVKEKHFPTLEQYVPIVARVHGKDHPEFHEVHQIFDTIKAKVEEAGSAKAELEAEFAQLRKVTDNYTVPNDVCESYEAVYKMLAEADKAYHQN